MYILHWIIEVKGLTGATGPLSCYCIWLRWKSNLKGSKAFETQWLKKRMEDEAQNKVRIKRTIMTRIRRLIRIIWNPQLMELGLKTLP